MTTRGKKPAITPFALRRQRLAQIETAYSDVQARIDRAYQTRWRPRMTKSALKALDREYARQVALLDRDYYRQQALTQAEYARTQLRAIKPPKRVSHAKTASSFWKHFARDGRAVAPWDIQIGPGLDYEQDAGADDDSFFAEGEYSYEDFDTDWGVYESEDTGYPDENT